MSTKQYGVRAYNAEGYLVDVCQPEYNSLAEAKWCAVQVLDSESAVGWCLEAIPVRVEIFADDGDGYQWTVAVGFWDPDAEVRIWTEVEE